MLAICPNKNLPEWKALEKRVGNFEAYRDFMENGYEIRDPEIVAAKIEARLMTTTGEAPGFNYSSFSQRGNSLLGNASNSTPSTRELDYHVSDNTRAIEFANKLSLQLGIDYQLISTSEAQNITKDSGNPWNGEKSFFVGGRVYFVGDQLSTTMVLHEFAHPVIRAIGLENNELFDNLFKNLIKTDDGQIIADAVAGLYPELDTDSDLFKEEVLVRSLEKASDDHFNALKEENFFRKAINNLLYNIRQFLRRVFGKTVSVSQLNPNTSMDQLANMLANGNQFSLDTEALNQDDVVAYLRNQDDYISDLQNIKNEDLQALVNRTYDIASKHIDTLLSRKEYDELAELLTDEFKRGDLQQIKSRVQEYQTMVANKARNLQNDIEYERQRAAAFTDSLFRLEVVMEKILNHMQDIVKTSNDNVDNLHKAYYYDYLVKYWENFIGEVNEALDNPQNSIPNNSPLNQLVGNISRSISRIKNLSNEMYAEGARDVLYAQLAPMNQSIRERYDTMIEKAKKNKAPQSRIDKLHRDYYGLSQSEYDQMTQLQARRSSLNMSERKILEKLERAAAGGIAVTPEKIESLLRGEMGDANFFNSYLEGYLYNTDPVIGGLASYVKDMMNEVMVKSQANFNDFASDLKESLDRAGYNPTNIGALGKSVGFIDTISSRNAQSGEIEEKKVWSFLNPFKNYRYDYDVLNDNVEKAQVELAQTGSEEARQNLINSITERQDFMRKYMNQEYIDEYYARQELFEQDEVGKEALYLRKNLFERMRALSETADTEIDQMAISEDVDSLWREYRQLHSEFNLDATPKTGKDLEIAQRLKQYQEASREFYEWKMRKGVFENAFFQYQQELIDQGFEEDSELFKTLTQEWIRKNSRVVIKDEYYQTRGKLIDRVKEILSKLPDSTRVGLDQSVVWEKILDLTSGFRDEDGQPDASQLSEGSIAEIKRLQQELEEIRKNTVQKSGLTSLEHERLNELYQKKADTELTPDEKMEISDLYTKKTNQGLSKWESAELDSLYAELAELSTKEATNQYVDTVNEWLSRIDTDPLYLDSGFRTITKTSANYFMNAPILGKLLSQNSEFSAWFHANHLQRQVYNKDTRKMEDRWERLYVWSVVRPTNEDYLETYEIKNAKGEVIQKIDGLPSMKYYARVVKPEYRTKRVVGETVDNRGNWLPKTMNQGAADGRYINTDYYDMQRNNPALFEVLEKLKAHHLKNQEGLSSRSKLYLDFPRYRKSNLEVVQSTDIKDFTHNKVNAITIWAKRTKEFFQGAKDDAESGFNDKDEFNLVRADMFDNEITNVPIHGLYNIDLDDVSTDITTSMMRYMLSGERQKQLIKISPVARAIQSVVNDPNNKIKELDKVNKFNFIHRGVTTYLTKPGKSVRASAVNSFIEREFEGQRMTGFTKDIPWINNMAGLLFKRASFSFFALNIPSALKNSYGAKFQSMIEASAGKDINHLSLQQGNAWAYTTMAELSFGNQLYKKGAKSLRQQLVEVFDPVQDRFEERFGESMSRTVAKDAASMSWLYNFRKWVELQASLQIFGGMMYHQKIKINEGTPQEKSIAYIDAWEVRDNKIQLKEGVDPKWGITYNDKGEIQVGSEFKRFRNKIHQKMNNLQGAYAKFDQPEAQRYLAFRFISYLRRYFTTMTLNRFGFSGRVWDPKPRFNPGAGDVQMGFYIEFLNFMKNFVLSAGKNIMYMTPEEKSATLKVATEVGMLVAATVAMSLIFGWDPEDDEKYEKLRAESGALPFPLTTEDPNRPFQFGGFMEVHALHLLMNIRAENEQFLPFPGYGLNDYTAMLDLKSIAFGPTLKSYGQLFDDLANIATGDDHAYYARNMGPYNWQQEGGSKFWAHFTKMFGLTGSSLDPAKAVKGFQSAQAMAR